ncbi:GPI-GlcNAc transferase complex, PIG-H component-domain-containing protein [Fomitopsis betulina]|nr:GPI-GlcNAc transferase complex, PIG-H component-domain-containing protein [Fomitopsis betulina]
MPSVTPLLAHPELKIIHSRAWSEFVVQHSRGGTDPSVQKWFQCFWIDAVVCLCIAVLWPTLIKHLAGRVCLAVILLFYAYSRCTQILQESVVVLPSLGLQLETQRGLPFVPLFTSRRFIPLTALRDFVINEGLHGWSVRYYLAIIQESPNGNITIDVPFENILPRFPVLLEVYHGVHELLFDINSTVGDTRNACDE